MKKIAFILLTLILLLGLIGCESSEASNQVNNVIDAVEETTTENIVETTENTADEDANEAPVADDEEPVLALNKEIPNFSFDLLSGETIDLHDYKGKIILLNFWASWCTYCDKEMPDLETVSKYEDVQVFAINSRENEKTIQKYIDNGNYELDVVVDEVGIFSDMFYITSLPTTFFINEEGELLGAMPGMLTLEQMDQIIQDIRDGEI